MRTPDGAQHPSSASAMSLSFFACSNAPLDYIGRSLANVLCVPSRLNRFLFDALAPFAEFSTTVQESMIGRGVHVVFPSAKSAALRNPTGLEGGSVEDPVYAPLARLHLSGRRFRFLRAWQSLGMALMT